MKTSERFTNAVTKLYNAFHNGELNAFDCNTCAVGNICNNSPLWTFGGQSGVYNYKGSPSSYPVKKKYPLIDTNPVILNSGYSSYELSMVETIFIRKHNELLSEKENQFNGLCAVVEYLCELEGIPNVMDYTCLFETENNEPKKQLKEVFYDSI